MPRQTQPHGLAAKKEQLRALYERNALYEEGAVKADAFLLDKIEKEIEELNVDFSRDSFELGQKLDELKLLEKNSLLQIRAAKNLLPTRIKEAGLPLESDKVADFYELLAGPIDAAASERGLRESVHLEDHWAGLSLGLGVASTVFATTSYWLVSKALVVRGGHLISANPIHFVLGLVIGAIVGLGFSALAAYFWSRVGEATADREANPTLGKGNAYTISAIGVTLLCMLLGTSLDWKGLSILLNGGVQATRHTPELLVFALASIVSVSTYAVASCYGRRAGYTRKGFSLASEMMKSKLKLALQSPKYVHLHKTLQDIQKLPDAAKASRDEIEEVENNLREKTTTFNSKFNELKLKKKNFLAFPSNGVAAWPEAEQELRATLADEIWHLEEEQAALESESGGLP